MCIRDRSRRIGQFFNRLGMAYTAHQLRHRFGTVALESTDGDIRTVQELMGHSSIESTQQYTFVDAKRKRAAIEKLPNIA